MSSIKKEIGIHPISLNIQLGINIS